MGLPNDAMTEIANGIMAAAELAELDDERLNIILHSVTDAVSFDSDDEDSQAVRHTLRALAYLYGEGLMGSFLGKASGELRR